MTVDDGKDTISDYATVNVIDTTPPNALCKPTTILLDDTGNAVINSENVDAGSFDFSGIASLTVSPSSFACNNVGDNPVTLTVIDNNSLTSFCTTNVIVEDNIAPNAKCKDITVQLDAEGNSSITAADIDNGSSDACGIASLSVLPSSFNCSNVGANKVTLTVTDINGNMDTCTATVTVEDKVAPVVYSKDITIQLDSTGNASIEPADVLDGYPTDACGIKSVTVSPNTFGYSNVGPNTVILTVTDNNNNVSTATAIVEVVLTLSGNQLVIKPETLNLNQGVFTVFIIFPEPLNAMTITDSIADGACNQKINYDLENKKAIIKFNPADITILPVDIHFEVTGHFNYNGARCLFIGSDDIKKVHEKELYAKYGNGPIKEAKGKNGK